MEEKFVYNGWLKVFKRRVGNKTYDILKDYDAVCAIIVNEFGEVLMVRQFRPALMEETIELPAGTLDVFDEQEINCLIRELKEETGLDIKPESVHFALAYKPMVGFSNSLMKVYDISVKKQELKTTHIEDADVYEAFWMNIDDLGEGIAKGEIQDAKAILAYLYLNSRSYKGGFPQEDWEKKTH